MAPPRSGGRSRRPHADSSTVLARAAFLAGSGSRRKNSGLFATIPVLTSHTAQADVELVRAIGLGSAILLVAGSVIGSGIFMTTGNMAVSIPSASLLLLAWGLGGVLSIAGGLTYAEMGAMFPRSGGVYVFLREGFGPLAGF